MDGYYDALATTIKIEDISSNVRNQNILRQLKDNDPTFDKLWICNQDQIDDEFDFCPTNGEELGWLGYYIGKNTTLNELFVFAVPPVCDAGFEDFRREMGRNKSIRSIQFSNQVEGRVFRMLDSFFSNNTNLTKFVVEECELDFDGARQLSLSIGRCNNSLKTITIMSYTGVYGQLANIITSLSMHPQLEHLVLSCMDIDGISECTALATLLQNTTKQLQTLNLQINRIKDEGIEALTHAISRSQLVELDLHANPTIAIRGWRTLSTLLEMPDSNLERLIITDNDIDDEGALVFANSLRGNCKLKILNLWGNDFTTEGWAHFSRILCDTSSINNTYLSNHTLEGLGEYTHRVGDVPTDLVLLLNLNRNNQDKGKAAMTKILQHHSHFNMQPFFEWELKVLPLMISWLEKARTRTSNLGEKIKRTKLSIAYDFVREFPMLYIEPVTRKEIEDCSAMEKQLQGDQSQQAKLEEVHQRKERAMRRLF